MIRSETAKRIMNGILTPYELKIAEPKRFTDFSPPPIPKRKLDTAGIKLEGSDFTREAVRRRDNHTCQACKKVWTSGRRFDVHHLNGLCGKKSKSYDKLETAHLLITLCHKCHLNLKEVRQKRASQILYPHKLLDY